MNDNASEKEMTFYKKVNKSPKTILRRNKQPNLQHSDSSKTINVSFQNKSEFIKPSTISILSKITKLNNIRISKINSPKAEDKYSNEKVFSNRITKGLLFYNRMKAKNMKSLKNNAIFKFKKRNFNFDLGSINKRNSSFLVKRKLPKRKINFLSVDQKINPNFINPIFSPINRNKIFKKHSTIYFPRINSANTLSPKSCSKSFDDTYTLKKREKEKEKNIINDNLVNLLHKIKQRILPKRKLIFEKYKLPDINSIKFKNIKSCIHKEENYKGNIEFIKTHLDGLMKATNKIKNKYKSEKRFEINEGYIDLEVLGEGDNLSFKTDLMEKNGVLYYEFNKNGRMETIEEKIHKIHKDKKEFRKLLKKYNENEVFKAIQAKDFENVKKNYGTDSVVMNNNIYKDLYHMIFKDKNKYFEMQKSQRD